jgi:hypothetical protein
MRRDRAAANATLYRCVMFAPRVSAVALLTALALHADAGAQTATSASDTQTVQNLALPGTVTEQDTPSTSTTTTDTSTTDTTTETTPTPAGTETTSTSPSEGTMTSSPALDRPVTKSQTGGEAGSQPLSQRRQEYEESCSGDQAVWPISPLDAIAGSSVTDRQDRWPWALLVVAVVILAAATVTHGQRRRGAAASARMNRLEAGGAIVGIVVALPAVVGLFFPGIGTQHHPPPQATMLVREVQARVTRGEFIRRALKKPDQPKIKHEFDLREIGDVIWVQMDLEGFRGDSLELTWASYSRPGGYSVIPATGHSLQVQVGPNSDAETRFIPIWVGLPQYPFQVRFRLIDDERELREVARTGDMRGSQLRYACTT